MKVRKVKQITSVSLLFTSLISTGCTKDHVLRLTYETLRQEDCHRNSFRTDYCDRSYTFEYDEYKEMRNNYFRQIGDNDIVLEQHVSFNN